jgi:PAS domain S-box-containing protein
VEQPGAGPATGPGEDWLGAVLDLMPDAVTVVDADGRVVHWNRAAEQVYGIARNDIVGRPVSEFFPRESVMLLQVLQTGLPVTQVYHRPRPDKHVFISAAPIHDRDGRLVGAAAVERDITAMIRLSERHAALQARAAAPNGTWFWSPWMKDVTARIRSGRHPGYPVLLMGEDGTGKASLAELAYAQDRPPGPLVTVTCDSLPGALADLELFGYEGADADAASRLGALERAAGGMVLLRRVEALPRATQQRLAQALASGEFVRIGGTTAIPLCCQVVATAGADLPDRVKDGSFASRLYYAFHHVVVPPLRARKDELAGWCQHFLGQACREAGNAVPAIAPDALAALAAYDWPGNLAELRHVMRMLAHAANGPELTVAHLPEHLRPVTLRDVQSQVMPLPQWSGQLERDRIEDALRRAGGNKTRAARMLGISRGSLYYKMRQYGIGSSSR